MLPVPQFTLPSPGDPVHVAGENKLASLFGEHSVPEVHVWLPLDLQLPYAATPAMVTVPPAAEMLPYGLPLLSAK
jgi:hypothetical protein